MGIRYDRGSHRATNGPMIFFSDPSSQEAIGEEIRGAINSGLSFYTYRQPGSPMIVFGSSEGIVEGLGVPGFVIGMFDPEKPLITIPYRGIRPEAPTLLYDMPDISTTKENYFLEINEIKKIISDNPGSKIVAARVVVDTLETDAAETFFDLCLRFPESYIYCFGTPSTGCWIGASPELLLECNGDILHTMSLAGTRPISMEEWDEKNIEEQEIVTSYITDIFKKFNLSPIVGETFSRSTGKIEHLCNRIEARHFPDSFQLENFLRSLSPTPALCGYPKAMALEVIKAKENFDRGCYGGFCGPYHSTSDFIFNVVVRCASFTTCSRCIYVGGGIISKSTAESEWLETEAKLRNTFTR